MDHLPHPLPDRVDGLNADNQVFVLLDGDTDRPDRPMPEWGVLAAVLAGVALRVEPLSSRATTSDGGSDLEVLMTVSNADNETTYVPALEAAGYDLVLRLPGHRVLTLPGCGVRVHVRDDDDPAAATANPGVAGASRRRSRPMERRTRPAPELACGSADRGRRCRQPGRRRPQGLRESQAG